METEAAIVDVLRVGDTRASSPVTSRPHHWARRGGHVFVSTDPVLLGRHIGMATLDARWLFDYLVLGTVLGIDESRSPVAGIQRVPPGMSAVLGHDAEVRLHRTPLEDSMESFADAVRAQAAIEVRGQRRGGVLCSGGLDSAVVAAAAREAGVEVVLLCAPASLSTEGELRLQRRLAEHLGVATIRGEHRPRLGSALDVVNAEAPWPTGGLFAGVFSELAERAAGAGIEVVLSGDGADDLLNPQALAVADAVARRDVADAARAWAEVGPQARRPVRTFLALGVAPVLARRAPRAAAALIGLGANTRELEQLVTPSFLQVGAPRSRAARVRQWAETPHGELAWSGVRADLAAGAEASYDLPLPNGGVLPRRALFRSVSVLAAAKRERVWRGRAARAAVRSKPALRAGAAGLLPDDVRLVEKLGRWDLADRLWAIEGPEMQRRVQRLQRRLPDVVAGAVATAGPDDVPVDLGAAWVRLVCLDAWLHAADRRLGREL
ncbi:MAG: asparagine synthase-related protein [Solirubrobacteraceae bacterium]